jgi:hypothetical protein
MFFFNHKPSTSIIAAMLSNVFFRRKGSGSADASAKARQDQRSLGAAPGARRGGPPLSAVSTSLLRSLFLGVMALPKTH